MEGSDLTLGLVVGKSDQPAVLRRSGTSKVKSKKLSITSQRAAFRLLRKVVHTLSMLHFISASDIPGVEHLFHF